MASVVEPLVAALSLEVVSVWDVSVELRVVTVVVVEWRAVMWTSVLVVLVVCRLVWESSISTALQSLLDQTAAVAKVWKKVES